jgi:hypothetical protein
MKTKKNIFNRNPLFSNCPHCNVSGSLRRSRGRNLKEQMVKNLTPFKYYRCNKCGWRGTRSTITLTVSSVKTLLMYFGISIIAGLIVYQVLKRFV